MAGNAGLQAAQAALALAGFDAAKHKRGAGGKFAAGGGGGPKKGGSVAAAHAIFDKLKGKPKAEVLAAAKAASINPNTAKTQLYHWQKKQAAAALEGNPAPTKADLQAAAAKALGLKTAPQPKLTEPSGHDLADYKELKAQHPDDLHPFQQDFVDEFEFKHPQHKVVGSKTASAAPAVKPGPASKPIAAEKPAAKELPSLAKLGPTKYVHALADHMAGAEKKAVVAAAVAAGVNKSTAGVQYGKWAAKQAGQPPQLALSPEPAALQVKQPQDMTDAELDKAVASYQGKLSTPNPTAAVAAKPYDHAEDYHDHQGGKALTAKLAKGDVYTNKAQGKTFYKSPNGSVYEHVGATGPMTKVAGGGKAEYSYDPAAKVVYVKDDGLLKPVQGVSTPVFKSQQPYDATKHVFKGDAWSAGTNGVQDPQFSLGKQGAFAELEKVHAAAGVTYNETSPAIKSYTGSGYVAINSALRSSKGASVGPKAKEIDELIAKSSFKQDTIMWRGVGHGATEWNGSPPPADLLDHAFTSVSFKPSTAKNFSDGKTLFRVKVPKRFPGLNVAIGSPGSGVAGLHGEAEVMLPRGTSYKVVARHAKAAGSMDVVDLEPVLPDWYVAKYGQPKLG